MKPNVHNNFATMYISKLVGVQTSFIGVDVLSQTSEIRMEHSATQMESEDEDFDNDFTYIQCM